MSVAEQMAAAPAAAVAGEALGGVDGVWIVGGAVRDALAARPVVDLDLAVAEDEEGAARRIASAAGGFAFELSAEFATWRAVDRDRSWHVDLTRLRRDSIEADLGERDFTVNALAVALGDPAAAPVDPYGGVADLEARVLRAVSPRSFSADPLRILRAARLGAQLGFELDPATVDLAREIAGRAAEPAGERQFAELRLLLTGPDPLRGLALLDDVGATAAVLPELAALRGVAQNPNHHLDVHGHTLAAEHSVTDLRSAADAAIEHNARQMIEPAMGEFEGLPALRRFAAEVGGWPTEIEDWQWCARFAYQVIERRGTGGGNFRLMYSRFLAEAGRDEARVAADAAVGWTEVAGLLHRASESERAEADAWRRIGEAAGEVLEVEQRLWPALAGAAQASP